MVFGARKGGLRKNKNHLEKKRRRGKAKGL